MSDRTADSVIFQTLTDNLKPWAGTYLASLSRELEDNLRANGLLSEVAPSDEQIRELVANLIPLDLIHDKNRPGQPQDAFEAADRIIDKLRTHKLLSENELSKEQIDDAMYLLFPTTVRYDGDDIPNPGAADKREGFLAGVAYALNRDLTRED